MKINNQNRVKSLRKSIEEIIYVLETKLTFDDDSGSEIKSSVKTKKNAFLRAKYLLSKLQDVETEQSRNEASDWYKHTIEKMIEAAEEATNELSKVMKLGVNTSEKSSAVNSAIDAKQEAYDYMDDIYSGVVELQGVLKSIEDGEGVKLLNNNDFKSGLAEEHAYYGFYAPKKRKIEPGYNKDLDAVVISYDGTVGEIIDCYGLRIALPKPPKMNSFPNFRKKKELQYWERPTLPDGLTRETATLFSDTIEEEFIRRDDGYWFLNNGEPEYITGAHYMLLTHFKANSETGEYFHFRKAHRDLFYFLEAAWVDRRSLGVMLGKTRQTGATHVADSFQLTKAISVRGQFFGMTSKKNTDAKKAFAKTSLMFRSLPFFFKPINTGEGLSTALSFKAPSQRTTKNSQNKKIEYDYLDTIVDYDATAEDSYDGSTLMGYIADEFSKWKIGNILTHFDTVKKALVYGNVIHGKMFVLSTVEGVTGRDSDDEDAQNGDRFKFLYYQSDINKRNPITDKTESGLYKIFIPATHNYGGFIDLYGNCISKTPDDPIMGVNGTMITMGVEEYLEQEWLPLRNDPSRLNDAKRKDPITEEDMFRIASEDSMFNILKIQDQIDYNTRYYLANGKHPYKTGNFRYTDSSKCKVEFVECANGKFMISWLPTPDMANRSEIRGGVQYPAFENIGIFGIDPYKVSKTVDGRGSKGGIVGYLMNHAIDDVPKNQFFLLYLNRPQTVDIFIEDAIMCMMFYGMPVLIENNVPRILEDMYNRGLSKYSMRRPDKAPHQLTFDELKYGGIPSTDPKLIMSEALVLESYIEDYVGIASQDSLRAEGDIGVCPFNDLLNDWMAFDITNRTKHDATVASCLAVYGAQRFLLKNIRNKANKIKASDFYGFTNNSGIISKLQAV